MAVINKNPDFMAMPLGFKRGNPIALDTTAVWYSYEEMSTYAASSPTAYVGQILSLVDEASNAATAYMIMDAAGTLQEVGKATLGDNKTITLEDGVLSLKNWGVQYYKWVEGEGDNPGQHVLQVVDEENPWIAGLEPKTSLEEGQIVIAWYQPSTVTVEDVNSALSSVQSTVNNITGVLGTKDDVVGTDTVFGQLAGKVDTTGDTMTGALILADGHEAISDNAVDTKIANAIGSAGHLKRLVVDALPEASAADADTIYMIKDSSITLGDAYKEYMLIDGVLVQIGDTSVDLEPYATKAMLTVHENNSVLCTHQTLTTEQQAQARENISAANAEDFAQFKSELVTNKNSATENTRFAIGETEESLEVPSMEEFNGLKNEFKNSVLYTPQALTSDQQVQARENVGAASAERLEAVEDALPGKLTEPAEGLAVGKYFRVAAIDKNGHAVLEAVDAKDVGVQDVQVGGSSIVADGVAEVPIAGNDGTTFGLVRFNSNSGISVPSSSKIAGVDRASEEGIDAQRKNAGYKRPITPYVLDYAVKAAMCDGQGAAWTADEQAAARERIGIPGDYEFIDTITIDEDSVLDFTFPYPYKNVLIIGRTNKFAAKASYGAFRINGNVNYPAPFEGIPTTLTTNTQWSVEIMTNGSYITIINTRSDNMYLCGPQKSTIYLSKQSISSLLSNVEFLAGTELIVYGVRA